MPEVTSFIKPTNARARDLISQRIADGRWRVDVTAGLIRGEDRRVLGYRNARGYVEVGVRADASGYVVRMQAHRVVWEYVNGPIPYPMQINHKNGVKDDNRISNLELVTSRENVLHAHATGLNPRPVGSEASWSKIDEEAVRQIRRLLDEGASCRHLAAQFGISRQSVADIRARRTWKHVA